MSIDATFVDPCLHGNMRLGLQLQITLLRITAVIIFQRAFDIHRVGMMTFDQVAVVAIHRPDQCGQGVCDGCRQGSMESG